MERKLDVLLSFKLTGSNEDYGDRKQGDVEYNLYSYKDIIGIAKKKSSANGNSCDKG